MEKAYGQLCRTSTDPHLLGSWVPWWKWDEKVSTIYNMNSIVIPAARQRM
jgi:hypothetical protein